MDDALLVCGFERDGNISGKAHRIRNGDRSALDALGERLTVHQLHRDAARRARLFESVDLGDVGMIEGRKRSRFAPETRQSIRIESERLR